MLKYVQPFATILYPILGQHLDCHHGFVVEYELGKDINLGFHVDDSEVEHRHIHAQYSTTFCILLVYCLIKYVSEITELKKCGKIDEIALMLTLAGNFECLSWT